jgi:SAM-dependent methyltransferase
MHGNRHTLPASRYYLPSMTKEYSQISDTARAIDLFVLPRILAYLESIHHRIAGMPPETPFVIADYGAADGANSSQLFECIVTHINDVNPSLKIRLVYIDIADPASFYQFWEGSRLSELPYVEAEYIQRSFYEPFPELAGSVNIGFSSTALHWLDTKTVDANFFRHPACIQANQVSESERKKFVLKWKRDWRIFFRERSRDLVDGGILFLANLTSLGADQWPASAGYNTLRDVCYSLYQEGRISDKELTAIFIPDYFATPDEMMDLMKEDGIRRHFSLPFFEAISVPCAYFARMQGTLGDTEERRQLACLLARVVRAWSESSLWVGLSSENKGLIDEIYNRLADAFFETPNGLPYQYCLIELVKRVEF